MIRIVHLSDIHYSLPAKELIKTYIVPSLINDLKIFHSESKINLVLLTGDLINKGGEGFNKSIDAFNSFNIEFLNPIMQTLNLNNDDVIFTIGNHDLDLNADEEFENVGLMHELTTIEKVNSFIKKDRENGYRRVLPFKEFEKEYHKNFTDFHDISNFQSSYFRTINGIKIAFICFNTAWRCYDSNTDKGNLLIGEQQITSAKGNLPEFDLCFGLLHHHLDWLKNFDKECITPLIEKEIDVLFSGHVHKADSWQKTCIYGSILNIIAPSNWDYNIHSRNIDNSIGYQLVEILEDLTARVHFRKYSHQKQCFLPDTERGNEHGYFDYEIPRYGEKSDFTEELAICTKIKDIHLPSISEHLINFNSDSKSPKDLNELFVLPQIVKKENIIDDDNENEIVFTINDLCCSNSNIIIFGTKESGKSILLDKLLIELNNNITSFRKIPVYIDFTKIGHTTINTLVSRYTGVGIKDIPDFIKKHRIVLLIDNIDFSEESKYKIKNLSDFVNDENNKNLQVICTSFQNIERETPAEFISSDYFHDFDILTIKSFKTKEIKDLTTNWFKYNREKFTEEKIDNLIKIIISLNLPRSPLAISMFLWIIEQQENFTPVNQATMLNIFIEKTFKKHSENEVLSEAFSYQNKIVLLSEIAFYMYEKNNTNYHLTYTELLKFITERISKKKFTFSSIKVLEHFINRGIFVLSNNSSDDLIQFRFNCFFEFFLMKRMEIDEGFKKEVLTKENYYYFENEIDYFTGLRRFDKDILISVVSWLYDDFIEIIDKIQSLPNSFDTFYLSAGNNSISRSTDEKEIVTALTSSQKPSEAELDKIKDDMLESIKIEQGIPKKNKKLHPLNRLEKKVSIAMRVLKNTEEIDDENLKSESYKRILKCTMAFASIYKLYMDDLITKKVSSDNKLREDIIMVIKILPLLIESWMLEDLGTKKLEVIIREEIDDVIASKNVTDLEKYLSVFLYTDLRGPDYIKYISKLIKESKKNYIYDMILFKIIYYYFIRSKEKEDDIIYLNLISDLLIKAKGLNKNKKDELMKRYKENKIRKLKDEDYQLELKFN